MNLDTETSESAHAVVRARRRGAKHIVAGVAGIVFLAIASLSTAGGALIGAIGIAGVAVIARRRGKRLSRGMSWLAAVISVEVALLGFLGFEATRVPAGAFEEIKHTVDSSQAHPSPPPAWLERIAPGSAARASARHASTNTALQGAISVWAIVMGSVLLTGLIAGLAGTIGWLATLPIAYAVTGAWIGSPPEAS